MEINDGAMLQTEQDKAWLKLDEETTLLCVLAAQTAEIYPATEPIMLEKETEAAGQRVIVSVSFAPLTNVKG